MIVAVSIQCQFEWCFMYILDFAKNSVKCISVILWCVTWF